MLVAMKGVVRGNTVILEDDNINKYDGLNAIVTFLDSPKTKKQVKTPDWNSFIIPSERGNNVELYMEQMRNNDRL